MTLADLAQSPGFAITTALVAAIRVDEVLGALPLVRNPRHPADLSAGDLVLIVAEKSDSVDGSPGVAEKRTRTVSIGALSRSEGADALADAAYQKLHLVVHDALRKLQTAGNVQAIKETGVQFQVDDIDVDGAIVIGGWAIDYRCKRPL